MYVATTLQYIFTALAGNGATGRWESTMDSSVVDGNVLKFGTKSVCHWLCQCPWLETVRTGVASGTLAVAMLVGANANAQFDTHSAIFATSFEEEADANYDLWPDHWNRKTSPRYPHYTQIEIVDDATAHNGRSLQVDFDGGGAFVATPAIPILPKFGYKVSVRVKAENLKFTRPRIIVELQNRNQERLQVEVSEPIVSDGKWHVVEFKNRSIRPSSEEIDRAIMYLDAPRERRGDLKGKLWIDQLVLERLPSMVVKTGSPYNVYNDFREVKVECTLSGIREQNPDIRFQLLDETSRVIRGKSHTEPLQGKLIVEDSFSADEIVGTIGNRPSGYEGSIDWTPDIEDYGFYQIRVEMLREDDGESPESELSDYIRELDKRVITLAVLPKLPRPAHGEFGWTLPVADKPLSFDVLADLLPKVGVHWVKMPVWYRIDDRARGEEIVRFAERTSASGIEVVGILDNPLVEDWHLRDPNTPSDIADLLLTDPSFWQPQFEHVMTRLSLRLRWWQLGNDWDTSFYGYSELSEKLLSVRQHLFRFGQDVKLGLGWRWPKAGEDESWLPSHPDPVWDYEQMSSNPPLDSEGLNRAMVAHPPTKAMRWVLVDPTMHSHFSREEQDLSPDERKRLHEDHVREFVRELVTAKIHGADGIFVANPFTGPEGIMKADGTPGELLLPWRTTAHLLGGCRYLGKLDLPNRSTNHVFENDAGEVLMIVWNHKPTVERLYLGESIARIDVWGKQTPLEADEVGRVTLAVDRNPSFVVGLHPSVTAWRMAVKFDQLRVPSVFSRTHENLVRGTNHFPQGVTGSFSIFVPPRAEEVVAADEPSEFVKPDELRNKTWEVLPRRGELSVAPHGEFQLPIHILLDDAAYGPQPVRIDFRIEADRNYRFSVWRNLSVGLGDVEIEVATKIDNGQLVVEQKMLNAGSPTDFKCLMFAPPRRRKRTQVVMLGSDGNSKIYQYPNGEQLLGKVLTLRAEEITGNRVLIYRFRAEAGEAAAPTAGQTTETTSVAAPAETQPSGRG